jgi:dihydrofolate reductase
MRKIVLMMSVSLDGYTEGPNRELDWHLVETETRTFGSGVVPPRHERPTS